MSLVVSTQYLTVSIFSAIAAFTVSIPPGFPGNGWLDLDVFWQTPMKLEFRWNAALRAKFALRAQPILAQMSLVFLAHFFPLSATTSHVQGSISNASLALLREHLNQKVTRITPKFGPKRAWTVTARGSKNGSIFFWPILSKGRFILLVKYQASKNRFQKKFLSRS